MLYLLTTIEGKTLVFLMANILICANLCEGYVTLQNGGEFLSCPYERVNVTCVGNETNSIEICFGQFGCHIYGRKSPRLAMVGPVELELLDVLPDPAHIFLSTFYIEARIQFSSDISNLTVTCSDGTSVASLNLQFNRTLSAPILSLNATTLEGNDMENGAIQWEVPTQDIIEAGATLSLLVLQFSPSVPECEPSCSLAIDTGSLTAGEVSVTLEVGTRYEVVARAESCGGDLTSQWSDTLTIQLQVPTPAVGCVAVPTYDSEGGMEMLELNVAWTPLMDSTEISPGVVILLSGYMVNYTTDTQSIEQTVSPSSCGSQCRDTLSGDEVDSVITTVTVQAWNTFGRGEETLCNKILISNINNIATVMVEVSHSKADVSLQWLQQHPVYPDLIQVFCTANWRHEEIDPCGETSDVVGKVVLDTLDPNVTYFYKVEANGEQPFVVQGYFTTMALDGCGKDCSSMSTPGTLAGVFAVVPTGSIALIMVTLVLVCLCRKRTKNTITQFPVQAFDQQPPQLVPVHKFFCDEGQLHQPRGIAVSNRGIFVSDHQNDSIQVFSEKGKWQSRIACNLKVPRGLDIDDNYLYVSNCVQHCVTKVLLSNNSLHCTSLDNKLDLKYPYGVTVVKKTETVFICDEGNCQVVATDLQFNMKYTLGGHGVLRGPVDAAYDCMKDRLYVADARGDKQITVFKVGEEGDATPVDGFSSTLHGEKTFKRVQGICIAGDHIYVADAAQHVVIVMDLGRNLVATIGDGNLYNPTAVTVYNGNVYITSDAKDKGKAAVHVYGLQPL